MVITADVECTVADGGGTKNGFVECDGVEDFAFAFVGFDDLSEPAFIKAVEVLVCGNGRSAEGAFEAELPLSGAIFGAGAGENSGSIDVKDLAAEVSRAGCGRAEFGNTPELAVGFAVFTGMESCQPLGGNQEKIADTGAGWNGGGTFTVGPLGLSGVWVNGIDSGFGLEGDQGFASGTSTGEKVGGGPVGSFGTGKFPAVGAVLCIDSEGKGLAVVFDLCNEGFSRDQQAGGHAQAVARVGVVAGEATEPLQVAFQVEAYEVIAGKEGVDIFPIRDRSGGGNAGLFVGHGSPCAPELAFPEGRAVFGGKTEDVEPVLKVAAGCSEEDFVANNDGTGEPATGQRGFPRGGEFGRCILLGGVAIAFRSPESWPVCSLSKKGQEEERGESLVKLHRMWGKRDLWN